MRQTNYPQKEIDYLCDGCRRGFDIQYKGPQQRKSNAKNIPLRYGSETKLWNNIIKEVRMKRVAGPYDEIPFDNYIQSPIGLVPKDGNSGKT